MKIATAAYNLDFLSGWDQYEDKIFRWVDEAVSQGAELLVFPEYAALELAALDGTDGAGNLEESLRSVSEKMPDADALHSHLASEFNIHILGGSAPVYDQGPRPFNRARMFAPDGCSGVQDKQIMTRFERDVMDVVGGGPLTIFDTALGKIGVLICYDSEFPLLGRALSDCDILLAPSCTEALSGYWRVRIGAMARALESQCVVAMASLVGEAKWSEVAGVTTGTGGVFGPPDLGFPDDGVLALGELNKPGWTYAEVDLQAIEKVRADGRVLNRTHWAEQLPRDSQITIQSLL